MRRDVVVVWARIQRLYPEDRFAQVRALRRWAGVLSAHDPYFARLVLDLAGEL